MCDNRNSQTRTGKALWPDKGRTIHHNNSIFNSPQCYVAVFEFHFDFVIYAYIELRSVAAWKNNTQVYSNLLSHLSHAKNSLGLLPQNIPGISLTLELVMSRNIPVASLAFLQE